MKNEEISTRVNAIFEKEFEIDTEKLTPEANLYIELGLDSLDSVDLMVCLEQEFKFKIDRIKDEQTIRAIRTISDVCEFVKSKLNSDT